MPENGARYSRCCPSLVGSKNFRQFTFLSVWLIGWDCRCPLFAAPPFGTCRSTCTSWIMMTCISFRLRVINRFHWQFPCNRVPKFSLNSLFLDISRSPQTFELIPEYLGCQLLNTSENKVTRDKGKTIRQRPGGLVSKQQTDILLSQNPQYPPIDCFLLIFKSNIPICVTTIIAINVFSHNQHTAAALLARSQYSEGPATGHLDTGFSWFPCVYKQMLRCFPTFQVATTCFSCSPPYLNLLVTNFIFCIHVWRPWG